MNRDYRGKVKIAQVGKESRFCPKLLKRLSNGDHKIGHGYSIYVDGNVYTLFKASAGGKREVIGSGVQPKK